MLPFVILYYCILLDILLYVNCYLPANPFLTELDASNNHIMEILSFKWDTFTMLQKFNMSYNELSDPNILNKM